MSSSTLYRTLLPTLTTALNSFLSSPSQFRIIHSLPSPSPPSPSPLLILDSSFNPPTRAHLHLALSALNPSPSRLLLLFSTHNADKSPAPAPFSARLALLAVFAADLVRACAASGAVHVDIGLTTLPYYTDKSAAIAEAGYTQPGVRHTHLMGFDTWTRFLDPKYYKDFEPPLKALEPYFAAGHGVRVTLRPSGEWGGMGEQRQSILGLERGEMEGVGGKREWAKQIEVVEAVEEEDVSSTRARRAVKTKRWEEVGLVCTPGVAEVLREEDLYTENE